MPKILIFGGVAHSIINFRSELIGTWREQGYEVTALTGPAKNYMIPLFQQMGIAHYSLPLIRDGLNPLADLKALLCLKKVLKKEQPDLVFAYTVKPIVLSGLLLYFNSKIKLYLLITGLGYAFADQTFRQRIVRKILQFLYRPALKKSEAVIFQNSDDSALFSALGMIGDQTRVVHVNGSGVNLDRFYFSEAEEKSEPVFLLMARLIGSKGVRHYADAAAILKKKYAHARFVLLGYISRGPDSIDEAELKRWQEAGTLEFMGWQQDVRPFIEACSVYVLPSYYREGVPRSALEALSMGRAIITTDSTGCRETVLDGVNGYLIPARNSNALAAAMESFILNPSLIKEMGRESRRVAEDRFDVRKVNQDILKAMDLV